MEDGEILKLFNYKGKDILIRRRNELYQIGIAGENNLIFWFENIEYEDLKTATISGREYARIIIDSMIHKQREEQNYVKKN